MIDVNVYQENIFHTKCKLKNFDLDNYLFGTSQTDLHPGEARLITRKIMREMDEIYNGRNLS
jgi:S-adenosylmethionine decarboxylase